MVSVFFSPAELWEGNFLSFRKTLLFFRFARVTERVACYDCMCVCVCGWGGGGV